MDDNFVFSVIVERAVLSFDDVTIGFQVVVGESNESFENLLWTDDGLYLLIAEIYMLF